MAAFGRADGPGTALVVGPGDDAVVGAFAEGLADGVDGREVEDVEAHRGDLGEQEFDVGKGAVAGGVGRCGTGEELVPTGKAGAFAVDPELQFLARHRRVGEVGIAGCEFFDLRGIAGSRSNSDFLSARKRREVAMVFNCLASEPLARSAA